MAVNGVPITDDPGQAPLLATKLFVPRLRPNLVVRPRLVARLDAALGSPLALISAPAGFGKTTLVSAWVRGLQQPAAWLALDEADNDPTRFLRYLIAAFQQIDGTIGRSVSAALETSAPPAPGVVVAALVNDLLRVPGDFVLVLDDCQVLDDVGVDEAIRTLVAHQPPQLHLVLATREDPQLPLARLRARGQLVELRAQDLRFTPDESARFLAEVMGLRLAHSAVAALDAQIEGWVAGLQLAALSLQGRPEPEQLIAELTGNHHFILRYLTEEVLRQVPPDIQTFLLETSVLGRLSGPLCDAVTGRGDSEELLEALYSSNVFVVPLDEEHRWYRYHPLFADLLRSQLQRARPQDVAALHLRASTWHERQGAATEAIEHVLAAGDYPHAVRLLEIHARSVVLQGYAQTIESWLRRLPAEWRVAGPHVSLAFAWSLLLRGRLPEIEPYLAVAEAAAGQPDQADTGNSVAAESLALRAGLVSLRGDTARGCELAAAAVARAPAGDTYVQGMTRFALGTALNYAGRGDEAIATYQEALPLCRESNNAVASMLIVSNLMVLTIAQGRLRAAAELCQSVLAGPGQAGVQSSPALASVSGGYSEVLYAWGKLDAAGRQAESSLDLAQRGGHVAAVAYIRVVLARILQARGDLAGATAMLQPALELRNRGMPAWVAPQVVAQQAMLALAHDDEATAAALLEEAGVGSDAPLHHTREILFTAYLRLLLHQARTQPRGLHLDEAVQVAGRILAAAEPAGRMGCVLETLVLRALVHHLRGDIARALDDLQRALRLAEPEGYVQLFVNEGAALAPLLRAARERGTTPAYVARLLAAFPTAATAALPPPQLVESLPEPLTERELEVLRLMATGLTYDEVAQRLVVSLNTVRFHVKGVYGKLGVDRRMAAIERATALGILQDPPS
jgi:LuxR family maltose regulon positive regulatory protein